MLDAQLKELIGRVITRAQELGAHEVEAAVSVRREFSVEILQGEIEKLVDAGGRSLSFELLVDGRTATASTSDLSWKVVDAMLQSAVRRARLASVDEYAGLGHRFADIENMPELDLFDAAIPAMDAKAKVDFAKAVESIALEDKRITNSHGSSFFTIFGETLMANSKGFSGHYPVTLAGGGVYLQAGTDTGLVDEGWYDRARFVEDLWTPEQIARRAAHRAGRMAGAQKVKTQRVPVILEPEITGTMLGYLARCITGDAIYMKRSYLLDKLGQSIAGANISVTDDPLRRRGLASRPWDGDGTPCKPMAIVDKGVLNSYLLGVYSGRKLNMESTGHASGPSNFYLHPGNITQEEMIKNCREGLLITGLLGQGFNPVTGDLSRGASGLWIKDGEIAFPVSEITVSGRLSEILNSVEHLGSDISFRQSLAAPSIQIREMQISGT